MLKVEFDSKRNTVYPNWYCVSVKKYSVPKYLVNFCSLFNLDTDY